MQTMLAPQSEATRTEPIAEAQEEAFSATCRDSSIYCSCTSSGSLSSPIREQVAKPGINNTTEVLLMGATAIIQILLFALGAAKVPILNIFDNTEFFLLTLINLAQTAVAYQINSATLMRTISSS